MKRVAVVGLLMLAGCTTRTLTLPGGGTYTSKRFGNKEAIGVVRVTMPDGTSFEMENFTSDQAAAIGIAVDAAVKAAIKSVAPTP